MSETATTIIKLLSALTSPKAAVKYISVAVLIVVSWNYFSELAKSLGTPEENISIVVVLAGVGLGSIAGQIVTWIGEFFWNFINQKLETMKLAKQAIEEKTANDLKIAKENESLLQKYRKSFPHLDREQKEKLRVLSLRDITLDFSKTPFKALFENKYVIVISQTSNQTYLVRLNPVITKETKTTWDRRCCINPR